MENFPVELDLVLELVKKVIKKIGEHDYRALEKIVPNWLDVKEHVQEVLRTYPYRPIEPPELAFKSVDYDDDSDEPRIYLPEEFVSPMLQITKFDDASWFVWCFFWTAEEGLSDLGVDLLVGLINGKMQILELRSLRVP